MARPEAEGRQRPTPWALAVEPSSRRSASPTASERTLMPKPTAKRHAMTNRKVFKASDMLVAHLEELRLELSRRLLTGDLRDEGPRELSEGQVIRLAVEHLRHICTPKVKEPRRATLVSAGCKKCCVANSNNPGRRTRRACAKSNAASDRAPPAGMPAEAQKGEGDTRLPPCVSSDLHSLAFFSRIKAWHLDRSPSVMNVRTTGFPQSSFTTEGSAGLNATNRGRPSARNTLRRATSARPA
ncbi:hypothetical protein DES52_10638 [Deinococcus yavapaiensis KR-236]|uniref:Uncharacterized protein n=1 Tax=Deinococcus yavapaiensis KR-236 TaxID=694435 RepID=A0A318S8B2_9DEIO|nr:hypothetical protein DES52_10638 [Deinococcus yavapaiensis KR-236]